MAVRVLCTGDIHIGRSASKVPDSYRCSQAWTKIVDLAIAEQVDLLAISGDIIDKENKSFEAIGPLQDGLRRLNDAGIDTVAIAGNHDFDVLPRLAGIAGTERFHLLGRGGTWERVTISRDGGRSLHVVGWSFPQEHVRSSPMTGFTGIPEDGVPVLGLLHGEVGNARSSYAPISADELWAHPIDFWLLGHIHVPHTLRSVAGGIALYPGSPYAMDPGEEGVHGVWMVSVEPNQPVSPQLVAISPVRYVTTTLNVSSVTDESDFQRVMADALVKVGTPSANDQSMTHLTTVSCRIRLFGDCPAHASVAAWVEKAPRDMSPFPVGTVLAHIDDITSDVRPPVNLELLAAANDPVGETARLLLALNTPEPGPAYTDLIKRTTAEMNTVYHHAGYAALRADNNASSIGIPGESEARQLLVSQGWRLLSTLIAQKETA